MISSDIRNFILRATVKYTQKAPNIKSAEDDGLQAPETKRFMSGCEIYVKGRYFCLKI